MSEHVAVSKVNAQTAEHGGALGKLVAFSLTLAIAPISSYFISERYLWAGQSGDYSSEDLYVSNRIPGNSTYAAITAIVAANVVLVAYIIVSVRDDKQEPAPVAPAGELESKKTK
ncbi:hypothetical protein EIP91_012044 [Steccherinum ochraceum]|uniref:Vacuolar ATPase assembly integral membrane protein VMA21 n=1 Tax=Steccherinum ochraceum TaxID=92696 RepID=A0A4R0RV47_9APHY|nr:hypothetical protein EIP91_012044 [Steccherinum ochraceum]